MNYERKSILLLVTIFFFSCTSEKKENLKLQGKVIGTETDTIVLLKPGQDPRFDSLIKIPVKDGIFYYEENLENAERANLAFSESVNRGAYRLMPLFLENEEINLTIYPEEDFDKNIVEGGNLNAQYKLYRQDLENKFKDRVKPFKDSLNNLSKDNEYFSEKAKELHTELRKAKNHDEKVPIFKKMDDLTTSGEDLSPKAKILADKLEAIYDEQKKFQQEYIESNPSIISYSFLLEDLIYNKETMDMDLAKGTFQKLSKAHPNHPYNDLVFNLINAIENIKAGKKYQDFSAPDLNGNSVKLSDKINGKVALLNLWATWCGPCIAKSRTMVPLYEEYKDKGFTIIGVAGEFKNTDRLVKFLEKEKWDWLNLVELDRQNAIWQKYGVDGGGGGMFLIDEKGIILAKDPTAEEVRLELVSQLNQNLAHQ